MHELVRNQVGLSDQKARRMLQDHNRFFYTVYRPNEVARIIRRQCRER